MSIPQIHTGPIISKLTNLINQSSPRRREAQGESAQRALRVERGDSFEKREVHEVNAQDSAHLRRVAAQKQHESISAPPTPVGTPSVIEGFVPFANPIPATPPVVGDRLAPTPGVDPTATGVVPSSPALPLIPTSSTPVTPPVVGDRLAPTPGVDPTATGVVSSSPTSPLIPTSQTPATPPVVGDRLAPTPQIDKESQEVASASDEIEPNGLPTNGVDSEQQTNQTFTKADLDTLLSAFGRKSGEKGFLSGFDLNADGLINSSDLAALLGRFDNSQPTKLTPKQKLQGLLDAFGQNVKSKGPNGAYDLNGDGVINASDLAQFLGRLSSQASANTPQQPAQKVSIQSILDAFNSTADQPNFHTGLDLNGDGRIDAADLAERLGRESS